MLKKFSRPITQKSTRGDFLKFPKVQYIPMTKYYLFKGDWANPFNSERASLIVCQSQSCLQENVAQYSLPSVEQSIDFNSYIFIATLNFTVDKSYFRHLTLKLIGSEARGDMEMFLLTRKYFMHPQLHTALFSSTGKKLDWVNTKLQD